MSRVIYDLTGKAALVTGASQGIGFGIALELARAGSHVLLADTDIGQARLAAQEMEKMGQQAIALSLDVTNGESVHHCLHASLEHFARIDLLVNNAGVLCETLGQPATVEQFKRCLEVNLIGAWSMSQAFRSHFKANRGGRIVNISSIDGRKARVDAPAYSAAKAALISLTQSLALELGPDNTTVNAVCPGTMLTGVADHFKQSRPGLQEEISRARELKRALCPEDIGRAVVFFASAQAKHITGQCLNVDRGAVMN